MNLGGWIGIFLVGLSFSGLFYVLYPSFEQKFSNKTLSYFEWIQTMAGQMFLSISKKTMFGITLGSTLGMGLWGYFWSKGNGLATLFVTLLFAALGWNFLRIGLTLKWKQRIRKFNLQLIDGLNLLANSLKSGLNLSQGIQVLVQEMPNPLSQEFGLLLSQEKLGLSLDEGLERMVKRIPSEDLSIAIQSILILRETGGDLSETFDVIASTIRERRKVEGKIQSMTAQGKMQATILMMLPAGILLILYFLNPEYVLPLFSTTLGWMMLFLMIFFQVIGGLWLWKIINIDV